MYTEFARNYILIGMVQANQSLALTSEVACFLSPRRREFEKSDSSLS